jgi:hypothetical protein
MSITLSESLFLNPSRALMVPREIETLQCESHINHGRQHLLPRRFILEVASTTYIDI